MKKVFLVSISLFLLFSACASTKSNPVKEKDVPNWYLNPPKIEGKYIGVGDAQRPQISLSKTVATTRAKAEISRSIETQMSTMVKSYLQASGMGENASAIEFTEDVTKSVSSTTLRGCQIEKTEIHDGRVYVMVVYDSDEAIAEAKKAIETEAKKDEALYNEFKANQGFDVLNKEIDNLKPY
tara:strand:+ start:76 stop:621 length:546 start_codon:yes stop_codon:yes gene_type:complete